MLNKIQVALVLVLIPLGIIFWYTTSEGISVREIFFPSTNVLHIGDIPVRVEIANSDDERTRGLSGRNGIEGVNGLLFIFPENGYHGIWMKDMKFPIDIIWIGEDLTISEITKNVSPDTYPEVFRPKNAVRYILETETHYADTFGVRVGQKVVLPTGYLEN